MSTVGNVSYYYFRRLTLGFALKLCNCCNVMVVAVVMAIIAK